MNSEISLNLKPDVANQAALPLSSNKFGDIRKTIDTGNLYIWRKNQNLGILSDWDLYISPVAGGEHTIEEEGVPLTQRGKLNFIGAGVTATDNPGEDSSDITILLESGHDQNTDTKLFISTALNSLFINQEVHNGMVNLEELEDIKSAQIITTVNSGIINTVSLYGRANPLIPSGTLTMEVRTVSGGLPSANILASKSINCSGISSILGYIDFTFDTPISALASTQYALVLIGSYSSGTFSYGETSTDLYLGGSEYFLSSGIWADQSVDWRFKLYMDINNTELIGEGVIKQNITVNNLITIDGRDISIDGEKIDTVEENAVALTTVKADADIVSAVSLKHSNSADHTQGTDQGLDTGGVNAVVVADVKDAVTKKHASGSDAETASSIAAIITGAGAITEPLDVDEFPFYKTVGTILKKVTWANIKATLKTYNDGLYQAIGNYLSNLVEDTAPQLGGDLNLNGHNIDFPTTANISDCLDEDNMASNSAVKLCTQQSIKAYVDNNIISRSRASLGAAQNNIADATPTKVLLDIEQYDTNSEFANYKFTAKTAGYYLIVGSVGWINPVTGMMYNSQIYINGSMVTNSRISPAGVDVVNLPVTDIRYLNIDEYVELYCSHESGVSTEDIYANAAYTYLAIHKLSS